MTDFDPGRRQLADARAAQEAAQRETRAAVARQRALEAERASLTRRTDTQTRQGAAALADLDAQIAAATAQVQARKAAYARASDAAAAALRGFAPFTDPRLDVGRLSDDSPFLLMPVRLETRFVNVASGGGGPVPEAAIAGAARSPPAVGAAAAAGPQLLIRIFPDDCSIDTFEPDLSTVELANAKAYWQGMWRAGGIEDDERAAWRRLVTAHGSGRAAYLLDHYQPIMPPASPTKVKPTDILLVIPTQAPLGAAEAGAIGTYWPAVWRAGDDGAGVSAARAALEGAVGVNRAAALVQGYAPYNLTDKPLPPLKRSDVAVSAAFVIFPPDPPIKEAPWTLAPRVNRLADRFVALGYRAGEQVFSTMGAPVTLPLYVGPDPSADPSETIRPDPAPDGPDLFVPDELLWLTDFDRAVAAGMGIRVDLSPADVEAGFDRLLVLGLELGVTAEAGAAALAELLAHHRDGRSGLALVPQGTPTHNTTGKGTGYTRFDDPDVSFDDRAHLPLFTPDPDPLKKRDGQVIAESIGVDAALFARVHGADGRDQLEARAMQRALWPATLGYWMDKLLTPIFSDDAVEQTRAFFTGYVRGRGAVPTLRIGGQPYGILPTTAFSRIAWLDAKRGDRLLPIPRGYLAQLLELLRVIGTDWTTLATQVPRVGQGGDAQKTLLGIVGLHPTSVEYYARYAETIDQIYNIANLGGFGPAFWESVLSMGLDAPAVALLQRLGYTGQKPDLLKQYFFREAQSVGPVVDDRPLSETDPVRVYTTDGKNYLQWLILAASTSLDALNQEQGFIDNRSPEALLYLYLRHALLLGYYDSSYRLHRSAGVLDSAGLLALKPEPAFVHIATGTGGAGGASALKSESRFAALYRTEPSITGSPSLLIAQYITQNLALLLDTRELNDQIDALTRLEDLPTAALERLFAEHIDCCSYRYDAWLLGLVAYQLEQIRGAGGGGVDGGQPAAGDAKRGRPGTYLGAYGWLEDLRPREAALVPAQIPPAVAALFPGAAPILQDPKNGGYVHAPSLVHARTAAVLRAGYLANATQQNPDTMSVNLSSDRVRLALSLLEGVRNGQSLGALLGYRFERGLHDDHGSIEVDRFIYPLRKAFPLVAEALAATKTDPTIPIEAVEARNVMDALKLLEHVRATRQATYPFGLDAQLPFAGPVEAGAINAEVQRLLDAYDAIADLALAEGVHQAVQGNFDRIGATLDAYSSGNFPPEPEVVQTPPRGITLTERVALHLQTGLAAPAGATPRALAEPALDAWLEGVLPAAADVACTVGWTDPATGNRRERVVRLSDLALRPLDLLRLVKIDDVQAMEELDDRVLRYVIATDSPRPDAVLEIEYLAAPAGKRSVFELGALVRRLRTLIGAARPLRATDALLHGEASPEADADVAIDRARIGVPAALLDALRGDVAAYLAALELLLSDETANRAALIAGVDDRVKNAVELLHRAALLGVPLAGWGAAYAWKQRAFSDLMARVRALVKRWNGSLTDFDARLAAYDALPVATGDIPRFTALREAEVLISTVIAPVPPAPATMRAALDARRATFVARRDQFQLILDAPAGTVAGTLAAVAAIATADLDPQPLDLKPVEDSAIVETEDLARKLEALSKEIVRRSTTVAARLAEYDAAASGIARVNALTAAAVALFGADFRLLPEFGLASAQAAEWANAYAYSTAGGLTAYLTGVAGVDFPINEWLDGVARVRGNMRQWEQAVLLMGALGRPERELVPVQFPFEATGSWVALPYPSDYVLDSDRLLYSAHYATPFDPAAKQCGLLLDEWTEVIPAPDRDTGITFNFDRPDSEPPQSMLLVTPAKADGSWQWADLVGALQETLDLAHMRAVEPGQIDALAGARFLPATVMAVTLYGITISTALAAANGVFRKMQVSAHA